MKLKEVMTSMDYEKLYKAYYLQVYSYTISLAKNREIAEEITQNTFYKAVSTTLWEFPSPPVCCSCPWG